MKENISRRGLLGALAASPAFAVPELVKAAPRALEAQGPGPDLPLIQAGVEHETYRIAFNSIEDDSVHSDRLSELMGDVESKIESAQALTLAGLRAKAFVLKMMI